jgi:3-phenylpropionate/trans-cinnamate dioxygenase ferredoxin component
VAAVNRWITVATVDELPEGELLGATVDGLDVLVANVGGRYRSIGSECTHEGCALHEGELDAEDGVVTCPCHGSMFDLETGEAVAPPAQAPEPVYRVRVEGDEIQVAKPS